MGVFVGGTAVTVAVAVSEIGVGENETLFSAGMGVTETADGVELPQPVVRLNSKTAKMNG